MSVGWTWVASLPAIAVLATTAWAVCTVRRNVGLVDIFWSVFFLVAAAMYAVVATPAGPRTGLVLALVAAWSVRLAAHLAARNWNAPEDHRYQAIRARNQPNFEWKSLYLVFGLQGLLAWIISAPLAAAMVSPLHSALWTWPARWSRPRASSSRPSRTHNSRASAGTRGPVGGSSTADSGPGRATRTTLASAASGGDCGWWRSPVAPRGPCSRRCW